MTVMGELLLLPRVGIACRPPYSQIAAYCRGHLTALRPTLLSATSLLPPETEEFSLTKKRFSEII